MANGEKRIVAFSPVQIGLGVTVISISGNEFTSINCGLIMFWLLHPLLSIILVITYVLLPTAGLIGILVIPDEFIGPLVCAFEFTV